MAENNYDEYYSKSDTYGEDDLSPTGGEQLDAARYMNEQLTIIRGNVTTAAEYAAQAQSDANAAQDAADAAQQSANTAAQAATDAQTDASDALTLLADLADDNKITPVEKQLLKKEYDEIVAEKTTIEAQADKYSILLEKGYYTEAYNSLVTNVAFIFNDLTTTSDVDGLAVRTHFNNYYSKRTVLLKIISDKAKDLADAAQTAANTAQQAAIAASDAAGTAQDTADAANAAAASAASAANVAQAAANTAQGTANAASQAAADAQTDATEANNMLADIASDSKITPVEKKQLKKEWEEIVAEKTTIDLQADKYLIDKTAYGTAYGVLNTNVPPLLVDLTTTSDVVGTTLRGYFKDYYNKRTLLLKSVSDKAKDLADAAQAKADDADAAALAAANAASGAQSTADSATTAAAAAQLAAESAAAAANAAQGTANSAVEAAAAAQTAATNAATAASEAKNAADDAQSDADTANALLSDISNDGKLTPVEKQALKKEWDEIVGEHPVVISQATKYGKDSTSYVAAYNALNTNVAPLLTDLTTTSNVAGTTLRGYFSTYYTAQVNLLKAISDTAKDLADAAQTKANDAATAAANAQSTADGKQNKHVRQPSTPPTNPADGDMWIDTAIIPNIIYVWSGTSWDKASVTNPEEVGTYSTAQIDEHISGVTMNIDATTKRVETTEQILGDGEGLASTITATTTYSDSVKSISKSEIKTAIEELNLDQYVTSATLERTEKSIASKITSSGGINLLKNSVGYAFDTNGAIPNWQITSGSVTIQQGTDMLESGSGFNIVNGIMKQAIGVVPDQVFTLTCRVKKGTAGSAYIKLSDGNVFQQVDMIASQSYDYHLVQVKGFAPATGVLIVEFGATSVTGGCIFTANMLNVGDEGLQWSNAIGEMYNTNVRSDINGLTVFSTVYDGYTVMSPKEFSGYARNTQGVMEKVFTLNKDTTEMTKAQVDEDMTVGSVKMVYINGGGYNGISFIPS